MVYGLYGYERNMLKHVETITVISQMAAPQRLDEPWITHWTWTQVAGQSWATDLHLQRQLPGEGQTLGKNNRI